MADEESTLPSWKAVNAALQSFDRAGLLGLVQDVYAAVCIAFLAFDIDTDWFLIKSGQIQREIIAVGGKLIGTQA